VMTFDMLVEEVRVHELGVSPGSKVLVEPFFLVEELMTVDGVQSSEVSPGESEHKVLEGGLWFHLEPVVVNGYLVTHND